MALIARTATIQVRVVPTVKQTSNEVLSRIGLTMSEAVELFLRRVIVDERIPFDVVALGATHIGANMMPAGKGLRSDQEQPSTKRFSRSQRRKKN